MNTKVRIISVIICVAACAACIIWACGKFSHVREINAKHAEVSLANATLKEKLHMQDAQTAEANKKIQNAKTKTKRSQDEMEKSLKASWEREEAWKKTLNEDPVLQNKQLAAYRATINKTYGPFFYKMDWIPGSGKNWREHWCNVAWIPMI